VSGQTYLRMEGQGPPLLLIHGVGLDHTMWDPAMEQLQDERTVIRYDLLGHGQTSAGVGPLTIADFVHQAREVAAVAEGEKLDVAGLSLGGSIALALALRQPELVRRVALLSTVFERSAEQHSAQQQRLDLCRQGGMAAVAQLAQDRWFTPDWQEANPKLVDKISARLRTTDHQGYLAAYQCFLDGDPMVPESLKQIEAPTLVMTGSLDAGSTPEMSEALAAALPCGEAQILPDLHHLPLWEDPFLFTTSLLIFLNKEITPCTIT